MRSYIFIFSLVLLILPSCFVVDNLLAEEEQDLKLPFDVIVKDSVYQYIKKTKKPEEKYLSYGFDPLKVIVPQSIKDQEKLEIYEKAGIDPEATRKKKAEKDSVILANNLTRKISIDHNFSLRDKGDSIADLQSVTFILSNNLEVIDYIPNYQVKLSTNEERLYAKFFYETPILKAYSYQESQNLSKSFYQFFKKEWEQKDNSLEKKYFLKHIIRIVGEVDKTNTFDVQLVSQSILKNYIITRRADIEGYKPIDFSALYEINEDDTLTGYYFFHTFNYRTNDMDEEMSIYVKFNTFYEVERIIETDQSYDVYIE